MSIKSMILISGLFFILSLGSTVHAIPSVDEEIEAVESARNMAPLLDFDSPKSPLLTETEQLPSKQFSSMVTQTRVQQALDNPDMAVLMPLVKDLVDEYHNLQFAKRIGFLPTETKEVSKLRHTLKGDSWMEKIEEFLNKMGPFYESDFWNTQLLN